MSAASAGETSFIAAKGPRPLDPPGPVAGPPTPPEGPGRAGIALAVAPTAARPAGAEALLVVLGGITMLGVSSGNNLGSPPGGGCGLGGGLTTLPGPPLPPPPNCGDMLGSAIGAAVCAPNCIRGATRPGLTCCGMAWRGALSWPGVACIIAERGAAGGSGVGCPPSIGGRIKFIEAGGTTIPGGFGRLWLEWLLLPPAWTPAGLPLRT